MENELPIHIKHAFVDHKPCNTKKGAITLGECDDVTTFIGFESG